MKHKDFNQHDITLSEYQDAITDNLRIAGFEGKFDFEFIYYSYINSKTVGQAVKEIMR